MAHRTVAVLALAAVSQLPAALGLAAPTPGPHSGGYSTRRAAIAQGVSLAVPAAAAAGMLSCGGARAAFAADEPPADALEGAEGAEVAELAPPPPPPGPTAKDFDVPFRGEPASIAPFIGKRATVVVNVKYDDPLTIEQMPALEGLFARHAKEGLNVLAFPTDQGWFEADDSATLRLKFKSVYSFGQYPSAVVFDKSDLLGANSLPLYGWMTRTLPNPWGVQRLVFNYEKFLLDERGVPVRRYPRKYPAERMDADVRAVLAGEPLPPPPPSLTQAWEDAKREATKSEYAFKPGLNYYAFGSPAS